MSEGQLCEQAGETMRGGDPDAGGDRRAPGGASTRFVRHRPCPRPHPAAQQDREAPTRGRGKRRAERATAQGLIPVNDVGDGA